MQALLAWSRKLEPLPARLSELDRTAFTVPECQTRVDLSRASGRRDAAFLCGRERPAVPDDAVLAIVFAAVNDQPPSVTYPYRRTPSVC
jgi:cysteine desulfuration protein SufE